MRRFKGLRKFCLALSCLCAVEVRATDIARETEFAEQIAKTLDNGEIVWLEAGGRRFLSIYTETEFPDSRNAAIVLHDQGGHPDQKPMMHALRNELARHRWSTLALQMPLRETGAGSEDYYALFPSATQRIGAAIDYLKREGVENIALVGYRLGALMALQAQEQFNRSIKALALIGLPVPNSTHRAAGTLEFIKKTDLPMLDLYSGKDIPEIVGNAGKKRLAAKQNPNYRQVKLDDDEAMTVKRIYSWLTRTVLRAEMPAEKADENEELNKR